VLTDLRGYGDFRRKFPKTALRNLNTHH
jgi:hypothetical protein